MQLSTIMWKVIKGKLFYATQHLLVLVEVEYLVRRKVESAESPGSANSLVLCPVSYPRFTPGYAQIILPVNMGLGRKSLGGLMLIKRKIE